MTIKMKIRPKPMAVLRPPPPPPTVLHRNNMVPRLNHTAPHYSNHTALRNTNNTATRSIRMGRQASNSNNARLVSRLAMVARVVPSLLARAQAPMDSNSRMASRPSKVTTRHRVRVDIRRRVIRMGRRRRVHTHRMPNMVRPHRNRRGKPGAVSWGNCDLISNVVDLSRLTRRRFGGFLKKIRGSWGSRG